MPRSMLWLLHDLTLLDKVANVAVLPLITSWSDSVVVGCIYLGPLGIHTVKNRLIGAEGKWGFLC